MQKHVQCLMLCWTVGIYRRTSELLKGRHSADEDVDGPSSQQVGDSRALKKRCSPRFPLEQVRESPSPWERVAKLPIMNWNSGKNIGASREAHPQVGNDSITHDEILWPVTDIMLV